MTVDEIASEIGGKVEGRGSVQICGLASLSDAQSGHITFLSSTKYSDLIPTTRAGAIVVAEDIDLDFPCPAIRVKDPDRGFAMVAKLFSDDSSDMFRGVHQSAIIHPEAHIDEDVSIGPLCVLERGCSVGAGTVVGAGSYIGADSRIGSSCRLYPHVAIRENVVIGDRVILHCGAVVGSDGFGYYRAGEQWEKIPQIGTVQIGNDVEIGANVTIDRARVGKTIISNGVKIDNLVQIAHNVTIGENTAMAAQVGLSGSAVVGRNVQMAGQSGAAGHLEVGDNSVVFARAGVTKNLPKGSFVSGFPAMDHRKEMRLYAEWLRIPERNRKVKKLEKRIDELERRNQD